MIKNDKLINDWNKSHIGSQEDGEIFGIIFNHLADKFIVFAKEFEVYINKLKQPATKHNDPE